MKKMGKMESHHGKVIIGPKIAFNSNAKRPYHRLSNFAECLVRFRGRDFPSSEHAFQSECVKHREAKDAFLVGGSLSDWNFGFRPFFKTVAEAEKNKKYWKQKDNIGILAKKAIGKTERANKVVMTADEAHEVFYEILMAKYTQNEDLKKVLLDTGNSYLFEFDRAATRLERKTTPGRSRWGAMVVDGVVVGHNQMGALLMQVRADLLASIGGQKGES
jgi:predicted NAD-dependent protein-ADP-ribosyltransferase YbiA (DUF1768 family)